jgi:DNA mismatch repair protein MutL
MIKVLSKETIDKIAAGEVVERPMSIVKELLENSIDSGATSINVEIKDGGISLIRVTDNGSGINHDEVRTAFLRHATGKIEDAEDLGHIMTLGFRGEALSSISAVCRCEIITKTRDELTAVRYIIEGGTEKSFEEIGAPDGTTMLVRDVFYNTPARRKFLKTASTEAAHITDLVEKLAMSHSGIAFKLIVNGQMRLQTTGSSDLQAVIYSIYGKSIAAAVIPVELEQDGIRISGYIGKPEISRPNRNYENYFVNGRYIKSNTVARAIEDAYEDRMMSRQFPFAMLILSIDPSTIDVNVHPTKMDVRFSEPMKVYDVIKKAVSTALKGGLVVPRQTVGEKTGAAAVAEHTGTAAVHVQYDMPASIGTPGAFKVSDPASVQNSSLYTYRPAEPFEINRHTLESPSTPPVKQAETDDAHTAESYHTAVKRGEQLSLDLQEGNRGPAYTYIGQVFDTYIIIQMDDKMYMIDQHAAHEKVYYERFLAQYQASGITSQMVDPPMVVTLTDVEGRAVDDNADFLASMGYEIEAFGGNEYAVRAIPDILPSVPKEELLLEMIDGMVSGTGQQKTAQVILERTATMACKAAIKGNHAIDRSEADALLKELFRCDNPFNCPHGRPTMIEFTKADMEKRFRRIL